MQVSVKDALIMNYVNSVPLIKIDQIGGENFSHWKKFVGVLFESVRHLPTVSDEEMKTKETPIWELIDIFYRQEIGLINGYPLQKKEDLVDIIVAYATNAINDPTFSMTREQWFRHQVEYLFAREILIQKSKSARILADEQEDRRLKRRMKTRVKKKEKTKELPPSASSRPTQPVAPAWKVSNTLYIYKKRTLCHQQKHKLIDAPVELVGRNDATLKLVAEYCPQCKKFYMSYTVYEGYRERYGMLLGKLRMEESLTAGFTALSLSEYSPLKLCGYSVSQQAGYSARERQYIIAKAIDMGALHKSEVISYLEYFINLNGKKNGNELALSKWREDLIFTKAYNVSAKNAHWIHDIKKY